MPVTAVDEPPTLEPPGGCPLPWLLLPELDDPLADVVELDVVLDELLDATTAAALVVAWVADEQAAARKIDEMQVTAMAARLKRLSAGADVVGIVATP